MVTLSGLTQQMKRAASNLHHKRELRMNRTCAHKYLCAEDLMLTSILTSEPTSPNKKQKASLSPVTTLVCKTVNRVKGKIEQKPVMDLRQCFTYMKEHDMNANVFYTYATDKNLHPEHPLLLCSRATFFRRHKYYITTDILPKDEDEGLAVGMPQYCPISNRKKLDDDIKWTVGLAENNSTLATNIEMMKELTEKECGNYNTVKVPSVNTTKLYQLLIVNDDPDVHLVNEHVTKKIVEDKWLQHQSGIL